MIAGLPVRFCPVRPPARSSSPIDSFPLIQQQHQKPPFLPPARPLIIDKPFPVCLPPRPRAHILPFSLQQPPGFHARVLHCFSSTGVRTAHQLVTMRNTAATSRFCRLGTHNRGKTIPLREKKQLHQQLLRVRRSFLSASAATGHG